MAPRMSPRNPNFSRVAKANPQWSLSKAFSASRANSIAGVRSASATATKLKTLLVPSDACLPLVKPTWSP
ncbi:hypothetical protein GDO78_016947 [Eleutherodactylus coqui]|uniref:Uncharacterized protein n=1 Tax=Eleutherodactylus coqui TaxID=57060 RepID=A0A8J6E658_ELECQ|nr:hypothetical protein GDO78_016947 [Eleutherodactylus coqui]